VSITTTIPSRASESYGFEMWFFTQVFSVGPGQEAALEITAAAMRLREEISCELRGALANGWSRPRRRDSYGL
jgi:hypothetical protein